MSEWFESVAAVGTLLSSIITAIVAGFLYKQTKNVEIQTSEIKKEISNRMRPWLKIEDIVKRVGIFENNNTVTWEKVNQHPQKDKIKEVGLVFKITNVGSLPTKKVYLKVLRLNSKITREILWTNGVMISSVQPLSKGETTPVRVIFPLKDIKKSDSCPLYVGVHVAYFIDDTKYDTIGKIWKLQGSSWFIDDYWVDDEPK